MSMSEPDPLCLFTGTETMPAASRLAEARVEIERVIDRLNAAPEDARSRRTTFQRAWRTLLLVSGLIRGIVRGRYSEDDVELMTVDADDSCHPVMALHLQYPPSPLGHAACETVLCKCVDDYTPGAVDVMTHAVLLDDEDLNRVLRLWPAILREWIKAIDAAAARSKSKATARPKRFRSGNERDKAVADHLRTYKEAGKKRPSARSLGEQFGCDHKTITNLPQYQRYDLLGTPYEQSDNANELIELIADQGRDFEPSPFDTP